MAFVLWACAYLERRCLVLYFPVTQQATDRFKWRMIYRCVSERGLPMSTGANHHNNPTL